MKRLIISIVILMAVGTAIWFGVSKYRRYSTLRSGEILLLVDKKNKTYTVFDGTYRGANPNEVSSAYKIHSVMSTTAVHKDLLVDYPDFSFQDLGWMEISSSIPQSDKFTPTESATVDWQQSLLLLTDDQKALCGTISDIGYAQFCLFSHMALRAVNSGNPQICDQIYLDQYKDLCTEQVASNGANVADVNGNQLIDVFEKYVQVDQ